MLKTQIAILIYCTEPQTGKNNKQRCPTKTKPINTVDPVRVLVRKGSPEGGSEYCIWWKEFVKQVGFKPDVKASLKEGMTDEESNESTEKR